jgi:hypothetical protein
MEEVEKLHPLKAPRSPHKVGQPRRTGSTEDETGRWPPEGAREQIGGRTEKTLLESSKSTIQETHTEYPIFIFPLSFFTASTAQGCGVQGFKIKGALAAAGQL